MIEQFTCNKCRKFHRTWQMDYDKLSECCQETLCRLYEEERENARQINTERLKDGPLVRISKRKE